jgi:iron transport multicopper oxidase
MQADQPVGNYWIRAQPNLGTTTLNGGLNSAILRYAGAPEAEPASASLVSTLASPLHEVNLVPLANVGAPGVHQPGAADVNINLAFGRAGGLFTVNGVPFTAPTVPVLLQIMSGAYTAQDLLPSGTLYTLPPNKVIEISMPAAGAPGAPVSTIQMSQWYRTQA